MPEHVEGTQGSLHSAKVSGKHLRDMRWQGPQLPDMPFVATHSDPIIHIWKEPQEVRDLRRVWT
jgi:hypothetical protein